MYHLKLLLGGLLVAILAFAARPAAQEFRGNPSLTMPFQNVQYIPILQSPAWSINARPWKAEMSKSPCNSQASVSVNAFLGYDHGRDAAKKLVQLADRLRKLTRSEQAEVVARAAELTAQMQSQIREMDENARTLRALLRQHSSEDIDTFGEPLDTELISKTLAKIEQLLDDPTPEQARLGQEAKQLRERVKDWQESVEEAGNVLCLR